MEHQHLSRAIHALQQGTTFAAVLSDGRLVTSEKKGIAPMMELLERDASAMEGASVADRVIGRAAAFLLEKGGAAGVYAGILSTHAREVLEKCGIPFSCGEETPYIINRAGTGMCPMEACVLELTDAAEAYEALRQKLAELSAR